MSYRSFTAGDIATIVGGLCNDYLLTTFTFIAQKPHMQLALQELQEFYELNNLPITNNTSAVIEINSGVDEVGFVGDTPAPNLPNDLVEIQQLFYSPRGQDTWTPMTKRNFLPHYLETVNINPLTYWAWSRERIKFMPSIANNDIKMDYIQNLFPDVVDINSQFNLINGRTFLEFRTAALCAEFIGENTSRADKLNGYAVPAMDRAAGINVKGQQMIPIRRRPFRASYKQRGR